METLTETSSIDSFANVRWPQLPDNPGCGLQLKLRSCQEKRESYFSIKDEASQNQSRIADNRRTVESQAQVSSSRKVGASAAISGVLNATLAAEKGIGDFVKQLNSSIDAMNKDIAGYENLITTTTMSPTSTYRTLPTTTAPCGKS